MTTWQKIKSISEELICIMNDAKEIRDMVLGNERVRTEIECLINDLAEIIAICDGKNSDGKGK